MRKAPIKWTHNGRDYTLTRPEMPDMRWGISYVQAGQRHLCADCPAWATAYVLRSAWSHGYRGDLSVEEAPT